MSPASSPAASLPTPPRPPRVRSMEEYQRLYRRSLEDPHGFWGEQAQRLDWFAPPRNVMDVDMEEVDFSWYGGARLNVSSASFDFGESGFAAALGAGLDVRASDRFDLRVFHVDYNPTRFGGATQHNLRLGIGLVVH